MYKLLYYKISKPLGSINLNLNKSTIAIEPEFVESYVYDYEISSEMWLLK